MGKGQEFSNFKKVSLTKPSFVPLLFNSIDTAAKPTFMAHPKAMIRDSNPSKLAESDVDLS